MLDELKRCNYLGHPDDIYKFAKIAIVDYSTDIKSVITISSQFSYNNLKQRACLAFFEAIGLIIISAENIFATDMGMKTISMNKEDAISSISRQAIKFLVNNSYMNLDSISYDTEKNKVLIKRSGISLQMAVIRNFLLSAEVLIDEEGGYYAFKEEYQPLFENELRLARRKISLEQLMKIHEEQEKQGRLAEEYVVAFEKKRLLWHKKTADIKQISDLDVAAGYDIVSFSSIDSMAYDRFIEVKSYHNTPTFYWSSNEYKTAKRLGAMYYLYLIDMEKYRNENYEPLIVENPAKNINMIKEDWIIETETMKITKI